MKITAKELRQIIREEISRLDEDDGYDEGNNGSGASDPDEEARSRGRLPEPLRVPEYSALLDVLLEKLLGGKDSWDARKFKHRFNRDPDFRKELFSLLDVRVPEMDGTFLGVLESAINNFLNNPLTKIKDLTLFLAKQGLL